MQGLLRQRMVGRVSRACHYIHIHGSRQLCQRQIHLPALKSHTCRGCITPGLTFLLMALLVLPSVEVSFLDMRETGTNKLCQKQYTMHQHCQWQSRTEGCLLDRCQCSSLLALLCHGSRLQNWLHTTQQAACYHCPHDLHQNQVRSDDWTVLEGVSL